MTVEQRSEAPIRPLCKAVLICAVRRGRRREPGGAAQGRITGFGLTSPLVLLKSFLSSPGAGWFCRQTKELIGVEEYSMRSTTLFVATVSALTIASGWTPTTAFETCSVTPGVFCRGHRSITTEALTSLPAGNGLSRSAADWIGLENEFVDLTENALTPTNDSVRFAPRAGVYRPEHHFDRPLQASDADAFRNGVIFVHQQYAELIRLLPSASTSACATTFSAAQAMGRALHALQDAYSHSNYADPGALSDSSKTQFDALLAPASPATPSINVPPNVRLTLYAPVADSGDPANPTGTCTPSTSAEYCHQHFSKDNSWSRNFSPARLAAVNSSKKYVTSVINSVGSEAWKQFATALEECPGVTARPPANSPGPPTNLRLVPGQ